MRLIKILFLLTLPLTVFAQKGYLANSPEDFKSNYNLNASKDSDIRCNKVLENKSANTFQIPMDGEFSILGSYKPNTGQVTDITLIIVPNESSNAYSMLTEMIYAISNILDVTSHFQMSEETKVAIINKLGILSQSPKDGLNNKVQLGHRKYWYTVSYTTGIWFGVEVTKQNSSSIVN